MALTDTAIKKLKPSDKCTATRPDKYSDMNGLQLWVRYTGVKSWVVAYRYQGKQQNISLGLYPFISLADARNETTKIRNDLAQGINPKDERQKAKQKDNLDFDHFAQIWFEHQQTRIKPHTFKRDKGVYYNHIKPLLGDKDIYTVRLPDIMAVHDRLALQGKTSTAHKVIADIGRIYDHAIIKGLAPNLANPIPRGIHKSLVEHKSKHYPRIKITELPKLLTDIDTSNSEPLTKFGFYVLCYTFVRTKELLGMTWQELDFDNCLWNIPANRMKNGLPHVVPLAPPVIEILQTIKSWHLHDEFVFFSNRGKDNVLSSNAFTVALKRMGYKDKMTGHGFRGLASTSLYEMQYNPQAIELQLSHVQGSKTVRAYNSANLLPARIKMVNDWANVVNEVKQGDFSTYKAKSTADGNEMAFISFLQSLRYKEQEIQDELDIHRMERLEVLAG
ncbi:tyrosine-type recombinase/integrase [Moraxella nasovis]|uniref:tyrosine-type recombinase/integrase n=1 Tax=Moraxella nasovis TaxID=2904121 RepID=UPI001F611E79|nr:integrase arm-type DNA-binding domain-containing protein [Moraxella nasovis]UNU74061.1 tyrosine-type recombinase/integrase [Moraxella nasovis]